MNSVMNNNKFLKVLITAQRARQLHKGAHPLVQNSDRRMTRVALEEIERGLIDFEFIDRASSPNNDRGKHNDGARTGEGAGSDVIAAKSGR
jgi:DNA-directed RNA polymerase omega subunit